MKIKIFDTSTQSVIIETVQLNEEGTHDEEGEFALAGVNDPGSEIKIAFVNPTGSMTGILFPSGNRSDSLSLQVGDLTFAAEVTMIDVSNPFVFIDATSLPDSVRGSGIESHLLVAVVERVRRVAAMQMGLAICEEEAAEVKGTPKIALLFPAKSSSRRGHTDTPDIFVRAYSMGKSHPSIQSTGSLCLAAATCFRGTVANQLARQTLRRSWQYTSSQSKSLQSNPILPVTFDKGIGQIKIQSSSPHGSATDHPLMRRDICIGHCSGRTVINVTFRDHPEAPIVKSCSISRTARKLFEGSVFFYLASPE